jgi:hypothetical protein
MDRFWGAAPRQPTAKVAMSLVREGQEAALMYGSLFLPVGPAIQAVGGIARGLFLGHRVRKAVQASRLFRRGIAAVRQVSKTRSNLPLPGGRRIDIRPGRNPNSRGHFNKVTREQLGFPHVEDPAAPGGQRKITADDYRDVGRMFGDGGE